jgi:hypothetical protein
MQTAQDIVAYLLAASGGGAQDGEHTAVRHAVLHGVREVMQCKNWLWHINTNSFETKGVTATGSVAKGSNVINLSSTAGFVPGRLVDVANFDDPVRIVDVGANHITVDQVATASATGTLVRPQVYYDLPADLKDIDTLATRTVGTLHCRISPQEWQRLEVNYRGSGEPYYYTVMRSDVHPDRYQIRFVGLPTNKTRVSYTYRVTPKPIKYMGYERICRQGTVSLANLDGSMTVTGVKTEFPQDCAGCYIRFGADGMEADAVGSTNPFIMERRIERWNSQTSLVVSSTSVFQRPGTDGLPYTPDNFDAGVVNLDLPPEGVVDGNTDDVYVTNDYDDINTPLPVDTYYAITDVVNASPFMYTAILSACEMWYARLAGRDYSTAMTVFNRDLRIAMENDVVTPMSGEPMNGSQYPTPRTMGWHSDLGGDIG